MYHHGTESYENAAKAAAEYARNSFTRILEQGRLRSEQVLQRVVDEQPTDALVPARKLRVDLSDTETPRLYSGETEVGTMHRNAFRQLAGRAGMPVAFVDKLLARADAEKDYTDGMWARHLAERNLEELLSHAGNARYLTRSVGGQVRGVLSDSYKRLHTPTILEAYVRECMDMGAVPIDAIGSDLRCSFRFALGEIFEPMKNELMMYGCEFRTADYGTGSLGVSFFLMRMTCTNLAIGSDSLRRVHIGRRLTDESIQYSDRTMALDAETVCSAMGDVVGHLLGSDHIRKVNEGLAAAGSEKLGMGSVEHLLRQHLSKKEAEGAAELFAKGEDVVDLPPEPTRWRLSNVLSLLANRTSDPSKRIDLQDAAGKVIAANLPS